VIDNDAFPAGFLRKIAATDCAHRTCDECGYCAGVAEKVVRISGQPPSRYRAPVDLPSPVGLLAAFGKNPREVRVGGIAELNPA